ncbi:MAG: hypothetical protein EA401_02545 [Planctomycetota bacterium]|nr:MAG: hypothetical protein EA401_02545 [Planctomycetota bacterium]
MERLCWVTVLAASAALLTGNLLLGGLVAPTLFEHLNRDRAGLAFGNLLSSYSQWLSWVLVIIIALGLIGMITLRILRGQYNLILYTAVLVIGMVALQGWSNYLVQEGTAMRDRIRSLNVPPAIQAEDSHYQALRKRFDYLHRNSTTAFKWKTLVSAIILITAAIALTTPPVRRLQHPGLGPNANDDDADPPTVATLAPEGTQAKGGKKQAPNNTGRGGKSAAKTTPAKGGKKKDAGSMQPSLLLILAFGSCMLFGCIVHRGTVTLHHDTPNQQLQLEPVSAMASVVQDPWNGSSQRVSAFPVELPSTVWLRDSEGALLRADVNPQTRRAWWQRFPVDFFTDLWPQELELRSDAIANPQPITVRTAKDLDAEAHAFGYASGLQHSRANNGGERSSERPE